MTHPLPRTRDPGRVDHVPLIARDGVFAPALYMCNHMWPRPYIFHELTWQGALRWARCAWRSASDLFVAAVRVTGGVGSLGGQRARSDRTNTVLFTSFSGVPHQQFMLTTQRWPLVTGPAEGLPAVAARLSSGKVLKLSMELHRVQRCLRS